MLTFEFADGALPPSPTSSGHSCSSVPLQGPPESASGFERSPWPSGPGPCEPPAWLTDWLTLSKLENVHATAVSELYLYVFNLYRQLSDNYLYVSVHISMYLNLCSTLRENLMNWTSMYLYVSLLEMQNIFVNFLMITQHRNFIFSENLRNSSWIIENYFEKFSSRCTHRAWIIRNEKFIHFHLVHRRKWIKCCDHRESIQEDE